MPQAYLGIDLHKASSTWIVLDRERNVRPKKTIPCTPHHVEAGIALLPFDPSSIEAVIEPVCAWRWFSDTLEKHGMRVRIANPLKTRLIAESRMKHDTLDALMLAELLKSGYLPEAYRAPDDVRSASSSGSAGFSCIFVRQRRTAFMACSRAPGCTR